MRRSQVMSFAPALLTAFFALGPAGNAIAENAEFENVTSDGSQIVAAGAADTKSDPQNLNTVPGDGFGTGRGANSPLVRQLLAARPNEDLVICVAGCFSGRDRVVYAQPRDKSAGTHRVAPLSALPGNSQNLSAIDAGNGSNAPVKAASSEMATPDRTVTARTTPAVPPSRVKPSFDPRAPAILNGASDGTSGDGSAAAASSSAPVNANGGATN